MLLRFFYWLSQSSAGGKGTPYNGRLYGDAPPGRGNSFRLQLYERVGISFRAVKRVKGLTELTDAFHAYEKVEKTLWFYNFLRI